MGILDTSRRIHMYFGFIWVVAGLNLSILGLTGYYYEQTQVFGGRPGTSRRKTQVFGGILGTSRHSNKYLGLYRVQVGVKHKDLDAKWVLLCINTSIWGVYRVLVGVKHKYLGDRLGTSRCKTQVFGGKLGTSRYKTSIWG